MNANASEIVQKLWNLCTLLKEDGVTFHQYVAELAFVLFPKMMKETGNEAQLPKGYRWDDIASKEGLEQLTFYRGLLLHLGTHGSKRVQDIYANATSAIRQPKNLSILIKAIDGLDWYSTKREDLGVSVQGRG